ncbi:hypothetical protein CONPUDRAFT_68217 [Coniophora puteana RWD-64-598 SS2]|uniref:Uncharacterized protein n=1 Tax=Coniophora puteana (strain RWD-64-598) TaxID=741705 RepID=R7SCI7_CONPW|nr:uncharacterized protein CONPUDRAFT_68217 [Coniophora puteana RWD-64-598 SS2]EIW73873.1 hypothetical protein CONPUDRAFT_68217 [Coniophora puteana RWD-64-598 SS2]
MAPFTNPTCGILFTYFEGGEKTKSVKDARWLKSLLQHPLYSDHELDAYDPDTEKQRLNRFLDTGDNAFGTDYGWKESSVEIPLPFEGRKTRRGENEAPKLTVNGVWHRNIANIVQSALEDPIFTTYNTTPFEQRWKTSDNRDIRVFSELYSSQAVLDAYEEINSAPRAPGDNLERIVVPLMLWSDATLLANFGEASLWPIYLFLGNQSKYVRGKPTSQSCHHLAYIPKLPDDWQNTYAGIFGKPPTRDVHTHLKRELIQAIWALLLRDKGFRRAYREGIVTKCGDGITRRGLIRFATYSGDYPEKIILCTIKFLGQMPCPRCFVLKVNIPDMGTRKDMECRQNIRTDTMQRQELVQKARNKIFKKGCPVNSKKITSLLGKYSYVPTTNAFSEFLFEENVNYFSLFPVDLLHEFELGVWKAVLIHLVRMVYSLGGSAIQVVNDRYAIW